MGCKERRPRRRRMRGSAVTELAILTPVLFLLTIGAFELGRGIWVKQSLSHLAREAVRYASVRSTQSDDPATEEAIKQRIVSEAVGLNPERLNIVTTWTPANQPGGTVRVQLSYAFEPVTPLVPFDEIELRSSSQRVIAY